MGSGALEDLGDHEGHDELEDLGDHEGHDGQQPAGRPGPRPPATGS